MEVFDLLNVSDLYESQKKLQNDLQNLMNLLDFCSNKNEENEDGEKVQKDISSVLSSAEESYLESIIENKVDAIINAAKSNAKLKYALYKLVDAFKVFDSQFLYSTPSSSVIDHNDQVSIQTQTLSNSQSLTESEVQTEINDSISEVIILETINNDQKEPVRIVSIGENLEEEKDADDITDEKSFVGNLQQIKKISETFKKLIRNQQKREKKDSEEAEKEEESDKTNQNSEHSTIIINKKKNLSLRHSQSNLSEAIKVNPNTRLKDAEVEVDLSNKGENTKNTVINKNIEVNNNKYIDNDNNNVINTTNGEHSSGPKPINVKNKKNYKRKQKNHTKETFTNPMLFSSPGSSFTPSPSQGIYLGKSNTQQTLLSTKIQSIFSKSVTSTVTTRNAECQTESYKVVIRGEDYSIPPGYLGHYAVVPLWTIWVIGYYYKKKTKPKSMWKLLALKTPGLLAKSRAQKNKTIQRVERISS
ncbi:hypothetical protein BCR36DRAFT_333243 [Piromyces finnis]|uniref:Uncharacterized protein n=1 Tax=Piromyces finnis TaxID=1754191 RepID=A0A1Y1V2Z0_9FUNG|nr:hypothetical protein BCR36DRAFT_333243 [Piromyces finnis]|eukprot:ORX45416.1 hypothetical protein BCR36DRAFT_333243 [Piromyces finnis]